MDRTCVIGDVHGALDCLAACFRQCPKATRLLVVGDLGFFPRDERWKPDLSVFGKLPPVAFIDGNHDDIPHLYAHGVETWPAAWLPRGSIYTDGLERPWLCMGGADSVDRTLRQRHGDFWEPEETITSEQIASALEAVHAAGGIYGVISHTAPELFCLPGIDDMPLARKRELFRNYGWDTDRLNDSRLQLDVLLEKLAPKSWVFSHFHIAAEGLWQDCHWHCLLNADHWDAPRKAWLCLEDV